jgi:hypothetical protein
MAHAFFPFLKIDQMWLVFVLSEPQCGHGADLSIAADEEVI